VRQRIRLKRYWDAIWDEIECFLAFSITSVPRSQNQLVDSMPSLAACFQPCLVVPHTRHLVEVVYQLSALDSIGCLQVFEDERHMFNFLNCINEFLSHFIDEVQEVQLWTNKIPRGLVPLEKLFNKFNVFKGTNNNKSDLYE
jgi:hypothetical protein